MELSQSEQSPDSSSKQHCFIIMPISDQINYEKDHFQNVYKDLIQPACNLAGFEAARADQVKQSNLIQLDILQSIINAPMTVCDLSSRNPNVLFELALRMAFDKPVALIKDEATPDIFDISLFRYQIYRKTLNYHEVLEDQKSISDCIKSTYKAYQNKEGINSIIGLLAIVKPATISEISASEAAIQLPKLVLNDLIMSLKEFNNLQKRVIYSSREFKYNPSIELSLLSALMYKTLEKADRVSCLAEMAEAYQLIIDCRLRLDNLTSKSGNLTDSENSILRQLQSDCKQLEEKYHFYSEHFG